MAESTSHSLSVFKRNVMKKLFFFPTNCMDFNEAILKTTKHSIEPPREPTWQLIFSVLVHQLKFQR